MLAYKVSYVGVTTTAEEIKKLIFSRETLKPIYILLSSTVSNYPVKLQFFYWGKAGEEAFKPSKKKWFFVEWYSIYNAIRIYYISQQFTSPHYFFLVGSLTSFIY